MVWFRHYMFGHDYRLRRDRAKELFERNVRPGTGSEYEFICLQEFAQLNPQFGVRLPFGKSDYPHMEPAVLQTFITRRAALGAPRAAPAPCRFCK